MSVDLSIDTGDHIRAQFEPPTYTMLAHWYTHLRDSTYQHMTLSRPLTIGEILMKNVGKIKWYLIKQGRKHGGLINQNWPKVDLGTLKGVRINTEYDLIGQVWKGTLVYRTSLNTWQARFIISEKELQSAQGM